MFRRTNSKDFSTYQSKIQVILSDIAKLISDKELREYCQQQIKIVLDNPSNLTKIQQKRSEELDDKSKDATLVDAYISTVKVWILMSEILKESSKKIKNKSSLKELKEQLVQKKLQASISQEVNLKNLIATFFDDIKKITQVIDEVPIFEKQSSKLGPSKETESPTVSRTAVVANSSSSSERLSPIIKDETSSVAVPRTPTPPSSPDNITNEDNVDSSSRTSEQEESNETLIESTKIEESPKSSPYHFSLLDQLEIDVVNTLVNKHSSQLEKLQNSQKNLNNTAQEIETEKKRLQAESVDQKIIFDLDEYLKKITQNNQKTKNLNDKIQAHKAQLETFKHNISLAKNMTASLEANALAELHYKSMAHSALQKGLSASDMLTSTIFESSVDQASMIGFRHLLDNFGTQKFTSKRYESSASNSYLLFEVKNGKFISRKITQGESVDCVGVTYKVPKSNFEVIFSKEVLLKIIERQVDSNSNMKALASATTDIIFEEIRYDVVRRILDQAMEPGFAKVSVDVKEEAGVFAENILDALNEKVQLAANSELFGTLEKAKVQSTEKVKKTLIRMLENLNNVVSNSSQTLNALQEIYNKLADKILLDFYSRYRLPEDCLNPLRLIQVVNKHIGEHNKKVSVSALKQFDVKKASEDETLKSDLKEVYAAALESAIPNHRSHFDATVKEKMTVFLNSMEDEIKQKIETDLTYATHLPATLKELVTQLNLQPLFDKQIEEKIKLLVAGNSSLYKEVCQMAQDKWSMLVVARLGQMLDARKHSDWSLQALSIISAAKVDARKAEVEYLKSRHPELGLSAFSDIAKTEQSGLMKEFVKANKNVVSMNTAAMDAQHINEVMGIDETETREKLNGLSRDIHSLQDRIRNLQKSLSGFKANGDKLAYDIDILCDGFGGDKKDLNMKSDLAEFVTEQNLYFSQLEKKFKEINSLTRASVSSCEIALKELEDQVAVSNANLQTMLTNLPHEFYNKERDNGKFTVRKLGSPESVEQTYKNELLKRNAKAMGELGLIRQTNYTGINECKARLLHLLDQFPHVTLNSGMAWDDRKNYQLNKEYQDILKRLGKIECENVLVASDNEYKDSRWVMGLESKKASLKNLTTDLNSLKGAISGLTQQVEMAEKVECCKRACAVYEKHLLERAEELINKGTQTERSFANDMKAYLQTNPRERTLDVPRFESRVQGVSRELCSDEAKLTFKKFVINAKYVNAAKDGYRTEDCESAIKEIKKELTPSNIEILKTRNDVPGMTLAKILATIVAAPAYLFAKGRMLFNKMWTPKGATLVNQLSEQAGADAEVSAESAAGVKKNKK